MAATDGFFRYVYEGCISGGDMGKDRRPYHKDCKCALHDGGKHNNCPHATSNVSYPMRRAWSDSCLVLEAARDASSHSSPSSSPSLHVGGRTKLVGFFIEEEVDHASPLKLSS